MVLTKYKAAAVTSEPCWFNLAAGVQKTIDFINEAGAAGCKLVAFPEVWIPGYPYWMWKVNYQQSLPLLKKYRENSLPIDSEEFRRIRRAARDNHMLSKEGLKMNTPEGMEPETDPSTYNGHARIYRPDGSLYSKPDKDFDGLMFVDIDLNESHLTKALADFSGHYMRPDLIRLLVDTRRKELVTEADPQGGITSYSTRQRLGLDVLLDSDVYKQKKSTATDVASTNGLTN
ncbi:cyanide hydratase [Pyrenophora seminiperda CCB06]|uniref:Cyanide hydratase n=1 Tax=Pyrenophora seminiperda CCB06 TaxID=1302712 RepID=A0A3M7M376_9PLEO|nr:cyanide hydratase [Pyrenophora seminiperda CCB06]